MIDKKVFWLKIAMHNVQRVKILDAINDLLEEPTSLSLSHSSFRHYVVKKLSSACILHNQVELAFSLDYVIELYYVRMADHFED